MKKLILFACLLTLICPSNLYSQTSSVKSSGGDLAKLSGKVTDAETGNPIVGASILIEDSKKGVNTDVDGLFFISVDKNRKYTIKISNIGYTPKVLSDIGVLDNNVINIALDKSKSQMADVVVTANTKRQTVANLYQAQKNSSSISDGITADLIRKSPDRNTGDVLKRVSGASIQENKFVIIRGMNERYNASLLNNSVLPSTEADKKAFAFNIIPSSLVDNMVIYKSPTPDLPGDFAGGAVKIFTKDYPSKAINELTISMSYNSLTTGKNFYKSYPDGSLDQLGFFDDSRAIPGPYYRHRGSEFSNKSPEYKKAVTKLFPNTFGYEQANKSQPYISVSYTGGNTKLLKKGNKFGYIYNVGYSNGRSVAEKTRDQWQEYSLPHPEYEYGTSVYDAKNNLSALLNLTYSYGKSKISFKNLFNNSFVKTTGIRNGYNLANAPDIFYYKSANSEAANNGIANSVLEGLHKLGKNWTVDWTGSFGYTYRNQPDQRILSYRTPDNDTSNYFLKLNNENSPEIRNAGRVYTTLGEYIYGVSANATKQFNWWGRTQKFKIGTMNYYRNRSLETDALGYASLDYLGTTIYETKGTTFNTIFSPENIDKYNLTVANIGTNSTDYEANAMLNAGYAMLDNKFSEKIKLTWGIRAEKYRQELSAKNKQKVLSDNTDILPSVLFTYSLNNRTNLRIAGSQAVNRPEFRELASYSTYDYDNDLTITGNPNLQRCKNTNVDLRYEYFPAAGEIISASIFYKYFKNPIERVYNNNDVFTYANAVQSTVYGAEIEIRKKLDFISTAFFKHLAFYTNAAYIIGAVKLEDAITTKSPMQGQSPYLLNSGLTYTSSDESFSMNVLYNRIGPRLFSRSAASSDNRLNIYENPRDVMDFQISKKVYHNKLEIKLTVSDILAQPYKWYTRFGTDVSNINFKESEDRIRNSNKYGTSTTLELRYNFGK